MLRNVVLPPQQCHWFSVSDCYCVLSGEGSWLFKKNYIFNNFCQIVWLFLFSKPFIPLSFFHSVRQIFSSILLIIANGVLCLTLGFFGQCCVSVLWFCFVFSSKQHDNKIIIFSWTSEPSLVVLFLLNILFEAVHYGLKM